MPYKYAGNDILNESCEDYIRYKNRIIRLIYDYTKETNKKFIMLNDADKITEQENESKNNYVIIHIAKHGKAYFVHGGIYNCIVSEDGIRSCFLLRENTDINNFLGTKKKKCSICKKEKDNMYHCNVCNIKFCTECCVKIGELVYCPIHGR